MFLNNSGSVVHLSDEDVPTILAQFRKRVDLKGDLHVPPPEIDKRAVRLLPLLLTVMLYTYISRYAGTPILVHN